MLERDVEAHFKRRVEEAGGFAFKIKFLGFRGAPDRLVFLPGGRIKLVELKRYDGRVSSLQLWIHRRLASVGCQVVLLSSKWEIDQWFVTEVTCADTKTSL